MVAEPNRPGGGASHLNAGSALLGRIFAERAWRDRARAEMGQCCAMKDTWCCRGAEEAMQTLAVILGSVQRSKPPPRASRREVETIAYTSSGAGIERLSERFQASRRSSGRRLVRPGLWRGSWPSLRTAGGNGNAQRNARPATAEEPSRGAAAERETSNALHQGARHPSGENPRSSGRPWRPSRRCSKQA